MTFLGFFCSNHVNRVEYYIFNKTNDYFVQKRGLARDFHVEETLFFKRRIKNENPKEAMKKKKTICNENIFFYFSSV